ncbi:MAG: hypothetical protein RMY64_21915 [Nostoc sp. DedQUE08]|nr:hypothetical protein [Nostoc sp. DedSLP04]MDZ8030893.1 hypothetical protein [Nostoc sp. DedSLP04]MDZ8068252.1 hypothetical protein [Nostoc sp. DedQUE08]
MWRILLLNLLTIQSLSEVINNCLLLDLPIFAAVSHRATYALDTFGA